MAKRRIFNELLEGVAAMKAHREGKITLKSYKLDVAPLPKVDSKFIRETREKLKYSRAVFARRLRINQRTLEKWEQGRAKPNPQAAALMLLVRQISRYSGETRKASRMIPEKFSRWLEIFPVGRFRNNSPHQFFRQVGICIHDFRDTHAHGE